MNIKIIDLLKKRIVVRNFTIEIQKKYQKLKVKRPLSKEQKKSIQSYYKPLVGHKVPTIWHQFMYSRTGVFAIDYMPLSLYRTELIGRMNQFPFMEAYADKNISYTLFPNVKQPKLIIKNMNGYFYTQDKAISREEAIALCENLDNAISDYEYLTDSQHKRVCAFGWWAGIVGVYHTLRCYGLKYHTFTLPAPDKKFSLEQLTLLLCNINLPKIKILITRNEKYISKLSAYPSEKVSQGIEISIYYPNAKKGSMIINAITEDYYV